MNDRQKRFCELYAIDGNATTAAIGAGYSRKTAASIGSENLQKPEIQKYIRDLQDQAAALRIASLTETKAFLSEKMRDPDAKDSDRIKAAELLLRSAGAFVRIRRGEDGEMIEAGASSGGAVIWLPPLEKLEDDEEPDDGGDIPDGWIKIQ